MKKYNLFNEVFKRLAYYLFLFILLIFIAANFIYFPAKQTREVYYKYENLFISSDNQKINAWYIKPKDNFSTIVFSHGNGGNISVFFSILEPFIDKGYGILIYDYRGYGKSSGIPFETYLYKDLENIINYLNKEKHTPDDKIVLWGLSLGGAVTADAAAKRTFKGVILQSTFTNIQDMVSYRVSSLLFPWKNPQDKNIIASIVNKIPFLQTYNIKDKIDKIKSPLLILHSKEDTLIPYYMAQINYNNNKIAKLILSKYGGHNDGYWAEKDILKFLEDIK